MYFVNVHNSHGYGEKDFPVIRDIITKTRPDYWQLLQPDDIIVYYIAKRNGKGRSEHLISEIKTLKLSAVIFKSIGIASSIEQFIYETNWLGKIKSLPIGNTFKTFELARADSLT